MGKFEAARADRKERIERDFKVREKIAGFFFDLAKLAFAAMVIGGLTPVMNGEKDLDAALIFTGIFATELLFFTGYKILK